jgi:hypothetical protein
MVGNAALVVVTPTAFLRSSDGKRRVSSPEKQLIYTRACVHLYTKTPTLKIPLPCDSNKRRPLAPVDSVFILLKAIFSRFKIFSAVTAQIHWLKARRKDLPQYVTKFEEKKWTASYIARKGHLLLAAAANFSVVAQPSNPHVGHPPHPTQALFMACAAKQQTKQRRNTLLRSLSLSTGEKPEPRSQKILALAKFRCWARIEMCC